ncbi:MULTISPECIES: M56 family metallopeptidase [unclassified Paenibacillus]|uniref:M56 family metallopeptidase n=1 Tax=unclassified Paenibacillus TaxID=185978 RepID=UPI000955481E|nr:MULTISPECIES: M56 family metallopeptidase [unclassified Paenibacillus]ASS68087.1 hypothetical protein CIC07_19590 [Paenibacillus sp. RUD330]SIR39364.1 bla regulator protein blaR1 [Paenibacillus sp. RU4X]SIR49818.1 bla regulator protein blaR1 [Paenibacillus sp. RU4T]
MQRIQTIFHLFLSASLTSTVLILALLAFRKLFKKKPSPKLAYALWTLVLIKLLVPLAPQSPISLFSLMPQATQAATQVDSTLRQSAAPKPSAESGTRAAAQPNSVSGAEDPPHPSGLAAPPPSASAPPASSPEGNADGHVRWPAASILALAWLGGFAALSVCFLIGALRFHSRSRLFRLSDDPEILSALETSRRKLGIGRPIPIHETFGLQSPYLYGLMRPRIYLPADIAVIADSRQLEHILLHELTHFKRKDLWINLLWMLAAAMHWYNPFVWLAIRKMKTDREVACDAGVLEVLGERESAAYGRTLLLLSKVLARSSRTAANFSPFLEHEHEMKRRITMIAKFRKGSYRLSAAAILALLAIGAAVLAQAPNTKTGSAPESDSRQAQAHTASFNLVRINDWSKWFSGLERANDFAGFKYKVPDYLPEGYRLETINLAKYMDMKDNVVSMTVKTGYEVFPHEKAFELLASKDNLLETIYSQKQNATVRTNAPATWGPADPQFYKYEDIAYAGIEGTLVSTIQTYAWHLPETAKSFVWQDAGIWYAVDYFSENHTREGTLTHRSNVTMADLEKMLRSYVFPEQIRQADYSGEGLSFPLYDGKDLQKAAETLGFEINIRPTLAEGRLKLMDARLNKAGDRNRYSKFRPAVDMLETSYQPDPDLKPTLYAMNDTLNLYQSKAPIVDAAKMTVLRTLDLDGVRVTVAEDGNKLFDVFEVDPKKDARRQLFYLWEKDGIHSTAAFLGLEPDQEENVKSLIHAAALAEQTA